MSTIKRSVINGKLKAPPSKSMMQRYVALSILTPGITTILSPSFCDDCIASLHAARALGATVEEKEDSILIQGSAYPPSAKVSCGESGTSIRILSAVAATFDREIELSGAGSLLTRPMEMLEEPLSSLGVRCKTIGGKLPITIHGPLQSGTIKLDGSITSQFLSGLLISLPTVEGNSVIEVVNLTSRPYIEMTLDSVSQFGGKIRRNGDTFSITGGTHYTPQRVTVEGDWSGASFPLVAGAIAGKMTVEGLLQNSKQADKSIINALRDCGAIIVSHGTSFTVSKGTLAAFHFDATDCPDLFPPLCALASACEGTSTIKGVKRLIHKESNRALALQKEFSALGILVEIRDDMLHVTGGEIKGGVTVDSHGDHRIAMSCAVASLRAGHPVAIHGAESVQKSYPTFFEDLERSSHE